MDELRRFVENLDESLDNYHKFDATLKLLYTTTRKYQQTCKELELLREATGFNKPFPILRLPREIRDEIYTYCLRAPVCIQEGPPVRYTQDADYPFRPPTPGLLLVNKQIYQEAVEILYSNNVFKFTWPVELLDWEEKIGAENRKRARQISIWTRIPDYGEVIPSPEGLPHSDLDSVPLHWIAALKACRCDEIVHMGVEAEALFSNTWSLVSMPEDLQECIVEFLGKATGDQLPRLSLRGFQEEERDKFPERWRVEMDQWDSYMAELEGLRREMEEYQEYLDTQ